MRPAGLRCHVLDVGRDPPLVSEGGEFATILAPVSVGMGVSSAPAMAVRPHAGCSFVPIAGKLSLRTVGIVRLRHHYETRAQQAFLAYAMNACGNGQMQNNAARSGRRKP